MNNVKCSFVDWQLYLLIFHFFLIYEPELIYLKVTWLAIASAKNRRVE
jgi:hypothetical protein